jgi:hypothetical protein
VAAAARVPGGTMQLASVAVIIAVVTLIIVAFARKQRNAAWQGVVTEIKDHVEDDGDQGMQHRKMIVYRTPDGVYGTWVVDLADFNQRYSSVAAGDRLEKVAGEVFPRVSAQASEQRS